MKFRKKPVVINAVEWGGKNRDEINAFIGIDRQIHSYAEDGTLLIKTLESGHGMHTATIGDMIIQGIRGDDFYPCKPDIFAATYEKVIE